MRKLFFAVIPSIFGVLVVLIVLTSGCVGTVCDSASMRAAMLGQMVKVEIPYIKPGPPPPGHLRVLVTYFVDDADGTVTKHLYNSISLEPLFDTVLLYAPLDVPTEGTREDKEAATWNAASRLAKLWDADVVVYGDRDISGDRVVLGVQATSSTAPADTSLYFLDKNSMTLPYDLAGKLGAAVVTAVLGRADTRFSANELNVDHLISAADEMGEVLSVSGNLLQGEAKARLWGQLGETAELIGTRQNNIYALKVAEAADIVALQIFGVLRIGRCGRVHSLT